MSIQRFDITWRRGDTTNRIYFEILVNGVGMNFVSKGIDMHVRVGNHKGKTVKEFTKGIDIFLSDDTTFYIEKFIVEIPPGRYAYDIEINDGGVIKTYIEGNLTVIPDITNAPR